MSPKIPVVSAKQLIRVLESMGYHVVRQKGSHIRLNHNVLLPITVPNHREIKVGLLTKILHDTNLTVPDLIERLEK